jgi:eukaryotic-like serine/threonine-protein kinase
MAERRTHATSGSRGAPALALGRVVVDGRFELVRRLGEGGMGVVWEALETASCRRRAIKFLRSDAEPLVAHRRFLREAEMLRAISHPNLVTIHEIAADDDGTPVIVMDLLLGESLGTRLDRVGSLALGQTCAVLAKVAAAVQAAHERGIVHRDLKPDNVFLCVDELGATDVRVLDFGIAKRLEASPDKLTETGALVGTPHYMSPEQATGDKDLDGKTDVWALAVLTFECLTGRMPILADNYGQLLAQIIQGRITKLGEVRSDLPTDFVAAVDAAFVPRAYRPELGALAAAFIPYADPAIEAPPGDSMPNADESSEPTVAMAPPSSLGALSATPSAITRVTPTRRGRWLAAGASVAVVGIATLGIFALRPETERPAKAGAAPSLSASAPAMTAAIAPATSAPAALDSSADAGAPANPAPKVPGGRAGSGGSRTKSAPSATAGRLQGGVGGDVPF